MRIVIQKHMLLVIAFLSLYSGSAAQIVSEPSPTGADAKVTIRNKRGNVTVKGWDRDVIEATVSAGSEPVGVPVTIRNVAPNQILIAVDENFGPSRQRIDLDIVLPRSSKIQQIHNNNNLINVSGISGVDIRTDSGQIIVSELSSANLFSKTGNISVENVTGSVNVETGSGNIVIAGKDRKKFPTPLTNLTDIKSRSGNIEVRGGGDIRIGSIKSKILLECIVGDVDVKDTSSHMKLTSIGGSVDVYTVNGEVTFRGSISSGNKYRLKTLSGSVSMSVPDTSGFTAKISSYKGLVKTTFEFPSASTAEPRSSFIGKFGNGRARIDLDSFDGPIHFAKMEPNTIHACR